MCLLPPRAARDIQHLFQGTKEATRNDSLARQGRAGKDRHQEPQANDHKPSDASQNASSPTPMGWVGEKRIPAIVDLSVRVLLCSSSETTVVALEQQQKSSHTKWRGFYKTFLWKHTQNL